uniref:Integrase_H2C2 domain-containing protein n=1 Tax=Strongyloides venezuelensis TaxID=75913 RepID=A0A0K0G2D7_STRVS
MKKFYLFTDCSKDCEAGVLSQEDGEFGNTLRPYIFYSKRLHYSSYTSSVLLELRALCHASLARFLPIVLLRYNWIGIKRDLANYINQCSTCKVAVARYIKKNKSKCYCTF